MQRFNRIFIYLLGMLVLALGIALNANTGLGASPIVSVAYIVSYLNGSSIGNTTLVLYCLFIAVQLVLKGRPVRWSVLLQLPLSLVFTRFLNVFDEVLPHDPESMAVKLIMLAAAVVLTGVGVAMTVGMRLVPNPGDGIVSAFADRFGKKLGFTKNCFDCSMVAISFVIGFVTHNFMMGLGFGSVVAMIGIGRVVAAFNALFKAKMLRLAGLQN